MQRRSKAAGEIRRSNLENTMNFIDALKDILGITPIVLLGKSIGSTGLIEKGFGHEH